MARGFAYAPVTSSVWLVGLREDEAAHFRRRLGRAGCGVSPVPSFEAARGLLAAHSPDVLVAPVRLGAFNGIHLAIIAHVRAPAVPAIVIIDEPGAHHELDARQTDAHYLVRPVAADELAGLVGRIAAGNTQRRLARRILARHDAVLSLGGTEDGRVLEFSDGGMRLSVPAATSSRLPQVFDVSAGQNEVTVRQAWHRQVAESTQYGLLVYQESQSCIRHWRKIRASFDGGFA